jgi:hypothetical protein
MRAWEGDRGGCGRNAMRGKGIAGAATGSECGRDECGRDAGCGRGVGCGLDALDAAERAPRLAVNVYNRYLISSRDWLHCAMTI